MLLGAISKRLNYVKELLKEIPATVVNHKRKCIPPTIEGKIVRDADKIAYIGKNRWKRCMEEEPEALDEIIEVCKHGESSRNRTKRII